MIIPDRNNEKQIPETSCIQSKELAGSVLNGRKISKEADENLIGESLHTLLSGPDAEKRVRETGSFYYKSRLNEITKLCIAEKKYHLLKAAYCRDSYGDIHDMYNKPAFQFLLDKIFPANLDARNYFVGGFPSAPAYTLACALEEALAELKEENRLIDVHPELAPIIEKCLKSLSMCIYFYLNRDCCESVLIDLIKDTGRDFPILIPVGYPGHSMEILVESSGPDHCTVTLCNSGGGLYHHPQWPGSRLRQFTLTYENVPLKDLTAEGTWEPFLQSKYPRDLFYEQFHSLMKNGTLVAPSKMRYDYQRGQMQGTCPTRGIMAYFRYYLLKEIVGTPLEKLGVYHYLKAKIYTLIGNLYDQEMHESIRADVKSKIEKYTIEQDLFKVAENNEFFENTQKVLREFLHEIGESGFLKRTHANQHGTNIEKFSLLLIYQQRIAHHFLENRDDIEIFNAFLEKHSEVEHLFQFSYFLITEKIEQSDRIFRIWNKLLWSNFEQLKADFSKLPAYPGIGLRAAQKWLNLAIEDNKLNTYTSFEREFKKLQEIINDFGLLTKGNNGDPLKTLT